MMGKEGGTLGRVPTQTFMQEVSAPTRSYSSTLCNDLGVYDGVINEEA